jgi:hypothetical protein
MPMTKSQLSHWLRLLLVATLHLTVLITPFVFYWQNEELFEFNKMLTIYSLAVIVGSLWIARMVTLGKLYVSRTPLDLLVLLFLLSQVLATLFSIHPVTSIFGYYTRFHGGLLSTLAYTLLFFAATSHLHKKDVLLLMITTLIGAIGSSLYAIPEHFGYSPSCWLISNGQQFDVACWVQDVKSRVFGTFGQPNWLAAYTIMLLPLTGAWLLSSKISELPRKWQTAGRIISGLAMPVLTATLLFTQSRSGVVGLAVGSGLFVVALATWLFRERRHAQLLPIIFNPQQLWQWLVPAIVSACFLLWFGSPYSPSLSQLLNSATTPTAVTSDQPAANRLEEGGTDSGEIRQIVWQGALDVWKRFLVQEQKHLPIVTIKIDRCHTM